MKVKFSKYQGTGNDFILIDNRTLGLTRELQQQYRQLCHRHFGIGADGLILLNNKPGYDFEMVYFNSDGNESTMCGNGGRCMVQFANDLGIIKNSCRFTAIDGEHDGTITENIVSLCMKDVSVIESYEDDFVLNTGSPHYVRFVTEVQTVDVYKEGSCIRYSSPFPQGINVNFVQPLNSNSIYVRTYERGVENETLSCGTGVVAAALVFANHKSLNQVNVETPGGHLSVRFTQQQSVFTNIYLCGPAVKAFAGEVEL